MNAIDGPPGPVYDSDVIPPGFRKLLALHALEEGAGAKARALRDQRVAGHSAARLARARTIAPEVGDGRCALVTKEGDVRIYDRPADENARILVRVISADELAAVRPTAEQRAEALTIVRRRVAVREAMKRLQRPPRGWFRAAVATAPARRPERRSTRQAARRASGSRRRATTARDDGSGQPDDPPPPAQRQRRGDELDRRTLAVGLAAASIGAEVAPWT